MKPSSSNGVLEGPRYVAQRECGGRIFCALLASLR